MLTGWWAGFYVGLMVGVLLVTLGVAIENVLMKR